jgi:hypothetical protein
MGDIDRGRGTLGDDDRLPWLEAVENEDDESALGVGKLIALAVLALVAIGLIVGGIMWLREGLRSPGDGSVIAAPEGPYKVPADRTGAGQGMAIEGVGDATYAASQGVNVSAAIDTTHQPEQPVTAGGATGDAAAPHIDRRAVAPAGAVGSVALPPSGQPLAKPVEVARATVPPAHPVAKPAPVPAPRAAAIPAAASGAAASKQSGAYSSMAKAEAARRDLQSRFPALGRLDLAIRSGTSNGNPVYRIFMKGPKARVDSVCAALHSAKEGCIPG